MCLLWVKKGSNHFHFRRKKVTINIPNALQVRKGQNPLKQNLVDHFDIRNHSTFFVRTLSCKNRGLFNTVQHDNTIITPGLRTDKAYSYETHFQGLKQ